LLQSATP